MTTNPVQQLDETDFRQAVAVGLTLVDFWAPWCGPCRMMGPILEQLTQRHGDVRIAKVNVDDNPELAMEFRVQAIPLLVLLKDGVEVERFVGVQPVAALSDAIQRHVTR